MQVFSLKTVSFAEAERLEAEYWASKTIAERVKAGWQLRENDLLQGGEQRDTSGAAVITFCRVERAWR